MKNTETSAGISARRMRRHERNCRILFILSLLVYGLLMFATRGQSGTAILAFFPIVTAAACWGWKGGLIAGLCAFPVNALALIAIGVDWRPGMLNPIGLMGHAFLLFQGLLIGFVIDLYKQRRNAEQHLKSQVEQNTADIERAQDAERQLAAVLEQSADGIYITENKTNTIAMVNRAFLEMVGKSREELIDKEPWDFVPEVGKNYQTTLCEEITIDMQYYEDNYTILQKLLTEGSIENWQYYVVNPQDKLVPVEANVTNLLNPQGERVGAISVVRDNTGHKLAEKELSKTNDYLNNVIENSNDCILLSDSTGHITHVNQAGIEMMGYPLDEMIHKTAMEFFSIEEGQYETAAGDSIWLSTEDIEAVYGRMSELFETGKISNYTSYMMHKNGRLVEVEHTISLLYDQQGNRIGSVGIVRDRSMRCRMERELNRQTELLSQSNRELESFAYSVSHDLRAPLRSISGFSAALEEDFSADLPDEAQNFLQRIQKASTRMGLLIDDLLNLSRVSRYDMQREQVDLSALADKIIVHLREQTPERSVACTIQPGIVVQGDSHLLMIMLENLIDNAWKYTAKQAHPEISFGYAGKDDPRPPEHEHNSTVFCVRDNGVGFDMTYVDKLFKPFQRLHAEKDFAGTGIGLATVQRIVHRHGGHTWAHSSLGNGANFYFTL